MAFKYRKNEVGKVLSADMDKTVVVQVERRVRHRLYGKSIKKYSKFYAHDQNNECSNGDLVTIRETKPISKTKRWRVIDVLEKAEVFAPLIDDTEEIISARTSKASQEAPVEEATVEEAPAEEAPSEEAPVEEATVEEAPTEEAPVEEAPSEEAPSEEAPSEEAPVEEATSEEATVEEAPVEEATVEEAPSEEAPVEEATEPEKTDDSSNKS
jgi:ribosomal protein uS17